MIELQSKPNPRQQSILDDSGRYSYKQQPTICKWNCGKLAEALAPLLPIDKSRSILQKFDDEYQRCYISKMRQKVGNSSCSAADSSVSFDHLAVRSNPKTARDRQVRLDPISSSIIVVSVILSRDLVELFFQTMQTTGADFTNSFRALSLIHLPSNNDFHSSVETFLATILDQCCDAEEWKFINKSSVDER